jgi:hypothetical protein
VSSATSAWSWLSGTADPISDVPAPAISSQHKGKLGVRRIKPTSSESTLTLLPPLGLGVIFYCDGDTIVGVLVSGVPPSKERTCSLSEPGCQLTYSEVMHKRARQWIGRSLAEIVDAEKNIGDTNENTHAQIVSSTGTVGNGSQQNSVSSSPSHPKAQQQNTSPATAAVYAGLGSNDFRSDRLIRLQCLGDMATDIMMPAVSPTTSTTSSSSYSTTTRRSVADSRGSAGGHPSVSHSTATSAAATARTAPRSQPSPSLPRPSHKYCPPSRSTLRLIHPGASLSNSNSSSYASGLTSFSSSSPYSTRIQPTILPENVLHNGEEMTGSRSDRIAAAYATGIRYGTSGGRL